MYKFLFCLFCFTLFSCVDNKDVFIPNLSEHPIVSLKKQIPSKSTSIEVDVKETNRFVTRFDTYIEMDRNAFVNSEGSTLFDVKIIEMDEYVDFIMENVEHETNIGIINSLRSIYITAELDGQSVSISEGRKIKIRFPSERINSPLALGYGRFEEGKLKWDYFQSNIDSRVEYIGWETQAGDGTMITEYGYEIVVDRLGWYSLVSKEEVFNGTGQVCVKYPEETDMQKTATYLMLEDKNYLTHFPLSDANKNFMLCKGNIPLSNNFSYSVISVTQKSENVYLYFEKKLDIDLESQVVEIEPQELDSYEMRKILESL